MAFKENWLSPESLTCRTGSDGGQGKGYGQLLLGHAVNLAISVRNSMGVRVWVVDAKDVQALAFYEKFGFRRTANAAMTLYLPIGVLRRR